MTQLTKQQVAKEILKPYFDNPSTCAVNEHGACIYLGENGTMCAFAAACKPEVRSKLVGDAGENLDRFGFRILFNKYRHIDDKVFWLDVQAAHDGLADKDTVPANGGPDYAAKLYQELTGEQYKK